MAHVEQERIPRGNLFINCAKCGAQNVAASCYDLRENVNVIIRNTTAWVTCSACGTDLYSKFPSDQIIGRSAEELGGIIIWRVSLVGRFLAILSVCLGILPIVGLAIAVAAIALNWRHRGWPKILSIVGLGLALASALFFAIIERL
jgi:hypothetical protein